MSKHPGKDCDQKDMSHPSSHLFLVRVWLEKNDQGALEARLCGKVQNVITGQAHYFRDGSELALILRRVISQNQVNSDEDTTAAKHKDQV